MTTTTIDRPAVRPNPHVPSSPPAPRPSAIGRRGGAMPRSTTRVIWTRRDGAIVEYGEVA